MLAKQAILAPKRPGRALNATICYSNPSSPKLRPITASAFAFRESKCIPSAWVLVQIAHKLTTFPSRILKLHAFHPFLPRNSSQNMCHPHDPHLGPITPCPTTPCPTPGIPRSCCRSVHPPLAHSAARSIGSARPGALRAWRGSWRSARAPRRRVRRSSGAAGCEGLGTRRASGR